MTNKTITIKPKNIKSILFFDDSFKKITNRPKQNITADGQNVSYLVAINNIQSIKNQKGTLTIKSNDFDYDIVIENNNVYAFVNDTTDMIETDKLHISVMNLINCLEPANVEYGSKEYNQLKQNLDNDGEIPLFDDDINENSALKTEHISHFKTEIVDDPDAEAYIYDENDNIIDVPDKICYLSVFDKHNNEYDVVNDMFDVSVSTFDDD